MVPISLICRMILSKQSAIFWDHALVPLAMAALCAKIELLDFQTGAWCRALSLRTRGVAQQG